ncbi:MAG: ParB N-terminal domain-containing protein [Spirochaetia bacterium]
MQIPIEDIVIKRRIRQDLGDLSKLMESLKAYGLMNPILINSNRELIAGRRRLEAAQRLGWKNIEAHIVDTSSDVNELEMEMDENLHRRNLSAVELAEGMSRLEKLRNPGFFRKIFMAIARFFRRLFGRR